MFGTEWTAPRQLSFLSGFSVNSKRKAQANYKVDWAKVAKGTRKGSQAGRNGVAGCRQGFVLFGGFVIEVVKGNRALSRHVDT